MASSIPAVYEDTLTETRPNKRSRKSNRKLPTTLDSKMEAIFDALDRERLDLREFLGAVAAKRSSNDRSRKYWLQFRRFAYQDMMRVENKDGSLPSFDSSDWDMILKAGASARMSHTFRKELSKLANSRALRWEYPTSGTLGFIDKLDAIVDTINVTAPTLVELLSSIARPSDSPPTKPMEKGLKQAMWVSMFLFSMQRHRCNGLAKALAIYLMDSGVKKRVVDMLSSLNVCVSYTTAQGMIKELRQIGAAEVRTRGFRVRDMVVNSITTYDNYDFVEHKSTERLGSRKTQRGITTALQFTGIRMPREGLRQNMWRPMHKMRVQDIVVVHPDVTILLYNVCHSIDIGSKLINFTESSVFYSSSNKDRTSQVPFGGSYVTIRQAF